MDAVTLAKKTKSNAQKNTMSVSQDMKGVIRISSRKTSSPDREFAPRRTLRITVRIESRTKFLLSFGKSPCGQVPDRVGSRVLYVIVQTLARCADTVTESSRRQNKGRA